MVYLNPMSSTNNALKGYTSDFKWKDGTPETTLPGNRGMVALYPGREG